MQRLGQWGIALASAVAMACGGAEVPPTLITVTGCLTASGEEFILTDLESVAPGDQTAAAPAAPATEAYLLEWAEGELRDHAGQRIRVAGEAIPADVAEIRMLQPPAQATDAEPGGVTPQVGVQQNIRVEVSRMHVRSVQPMEGTCR
jgi:hypothetical protein